MMNRSFISEKQLSKKFEVLIAIKLLSEISADIGNDTADVSYRYYYDITKNNTQIGTDNWTKYFCNQEQDVLAEKVFEISQTVTYEEEVEDYFTLLISKGIVIPEPQAISNYIIEFPDMLDVVINTCNLAKEKVDNKAQLSLELYNDPEIDDSYLILYIRCEYYNDDILALIDDISAAFEKNLENKSGWLIVTTDFSNPRR